ncbi:hypothetical protein HYS48_01005 [Candidatus Woesearchaeota archaeon]|nr:hypothetical protein [Candidatus Woesearchaeota archaeon]
MIEDGLQGVMEGIATHGKTLHEITTLDIPHPHIVKDLSLLVLGVKPAILFYLLHQDYAVAPPSMNPHEPDVEPEIPPQVRGYLWRLFQEKGFFGQEFVLENHAGIRYAVAQERDMLLEVLQNGVGNGKSIACLGLPEDSIPFNPTSQDHINALQSFFEHLPENHGHLPHEMLPQRYWYMDFLPKQGRYFITRDHQCWEYDEAILTKPQLAYLARMESIVQMLDAKLPRQMGAKPLHDRIVEHGRKAYGCSAPTVRPSA